MAMVALWHLRWVRRLPGLVELPSDAAAPSNAPMLRCSVVIAARDEAARIEETLRHLRAQAGVEAEFIIVDDRSVDGTGTILQRFAREDARVRVMRVDTLPEGWLGKCHACHIGAAAATGEWILFTDADCWLKPDVILRAIRLADRHCVDHITMSPGTDLESPATRAWHLLFLISLLGWFAGVNRDKPGSHIGIGAFNLVRTSAYRKCGGYEALRLTVVDDVKLGLLVRRAGCRSRAFLGGDDVECHWGKTVMSMVRIMEKNYFAALDYRLDLVIAGSLFTLLILVILALGLFSGRAAGIAAFLSPLSLILPGGILARRVGWSWPCALIVPYMFPVFFYALLNSTIKTLRQGGIRWRDTFYPLEALRSGNVR